MTQHRRIALSLVMMLFERGRADGVLRQDIAYNFINNKEPGGYTLHTSMTVDGQEVNLVVDTGSAYLTWIWRSFYDKAVGRGACEKVFFKCYECLQPCEPTEITDLKFGDGTQSVEVFKHWATISFGTTSLGNLAFGLICGSSPPPKKKTPNAILGLGVGVNAEYPSLLRQLLMGSPKLIEKNVFALYLRKKLPGSGTRKGELLLGGGDQSLYDGPLDFVPTLSEGPWMVGLRALQLENGKAITAINATILLDTGSNYIFIPQAKIDETIESIDEATATVVGKLPKSKLLSLNQA